MAEERVFSLNNEAIDNNAEMKSGVYQIRCYHKGKPVVGNRLLGKDKLGILYIGFSSHIKRRLKEFLRGIEGKGGEHPAGYKYFILKLYAVRKLHKNNLKFTLQYCSDYKKEEARLLLGYSDYFGELPPLNNQDVNEYYWNLNFRDYPKAFKW